MIYLDHHATTPLDPRVFAAMKPYFLREFANAGSVTHGPGRRAARAVDRARARTAALLGADPREIVFTSGATEANNLALKGAARALRSKGAGLVAAPTEHKSVLDPLKRLESEGFRVSWLPVRGDGLIDPAAFERALGGGAVMASVMLANNETGVIQPVRELARIAASRGVLFHCDAAQAVGKVPVSVKELGVDLLSLSAHKFYGPKGIGALYVRKSDPRPVIVPLLDGGGQEGGLRSGTLNVPAIVGLGQACELARKGLRAESARIRALRDRLLEKLSRGLPGLTVNGSMEARLANNLNVSLPGISAAALLKAMPSLALSSGSACLSSSPEPSYVLKAMGLAPEARSAAIRFGLGRFTTRAEIDRAAQEVIRAARKMRPAFR